jgi:hypothetical protein
MRKWTAALAVASVVIGLGAIGAQAGAPHARSASYLGTRVPIEQAPWAAALVPLDEHFKPAKVRPNHALRCSAAVIGPRLVLTSKHCIVDIDTSHFGFRVGTDDVNDRRGHVVPIARVWARQVRYPTLLKDGNDVAVAETKKPLGVPALPIASERPQPGEMVTSFGFGRDEQGLSDLPRPWLRRLDAVVLDGCFGVERDDPTPICVRAQNGGTILHGDSGGPLVVWRDGSPALVGTAVREVSMGAGSSNVFSDAVAARSFVTAPPASAQALVMTRPVRMTGDLRPDGKVRCSAGFSPRPTSVITLWTLNPHGLAGTYYDVHGQRRRFVDTQAYDSLRPTFHIPRNAGGKSLQCIVGAYSGPWFALRAVVVRKVPRR